MGTAAYRSCTCLHLQYHELGGFRVSRPHNLWIEYNTDTRNPINSWYCQCKAGARMVGCRTHVTSVLWYLGYYQYKDLEKTLPEIW